MFDFLKRSRPTARPLFSRKAKKKKAKKKAKKTAKKTAKRKPLKPVFERVRVTRQPAWLKSGPDLVGKTFLVASESRGGYELKIPRAVRVALGYDEGDTLWVAFSHLEAVG